MELHGKAQLLDDCLRVEQLAATFSQRTRLTARYGYYGPLNDLTTADRVWLEQDSP